MKYYQCQHCGNMHLEGTLCPKLNTPDFKSSAGAWDAKAAAQWKGGGGGALQGERWVLDHDAARMAAIDAEAKRQQLDGLCSAWTCDWLRRMLLRETITVDTYRDLTSVALMQKWFEGRANKLAGVDGLDSPVVGAGIVSSEKPVAKGLLKEVMGNGGGVARYNHLTHGAYYISMWGNGGRHGVGVVFDSHGYAVFDQNQGMLIGPVVAPKLRALRVAMEPYAARGLLTHWEMYSVKIALQAGFYGDPDVKGRSAAAAAGAAGAGTAAAGTAAAAAAAGAGAAAAPDAAAAAARPDPAALAARLHAASRALPPLTRRRSF